MKKVVQDLTSGGIDWQREKWQSGLGSKFIHQGEKNAAKYADEVIVLSKGVQDYFKETYGRETHFIPNGVNRPQIREANLITEKFGLKKDSYILFLGRLVPEKGIRYLVEAFKNVKTDKKLVIAGGSSDTDSFMAELRELANGDNRILFTGFVQGAMLDELYSNAYAGKKVCVLNFASATNSGGGVIKGSSAQEEAICRCSTLYPNLKEQRMWNQFYAPHRRAHDPLHNDDCIYTPGVMVFKSDTDYPQLLPEEKWYSVNVLTCAAPNLRERPSNEMNAGDGDDSAITASFGVGQMERR